MALGNVEEEKVRNSLLNSKVGEGGGTESASLPRAEIPLEETTLEQMYTQQPMEDPIPEQKDVR